MTNANGGKASVPERDGKTRSETKRRVRREAMEHVAARIPVKDVARIDALAVKYTTPWFKLTRSDMMRKLLFKALDAEEAAAAIELVKDAAAPDEDEE